MKKQRIISIMRSILCSINLFCIIGYLVNTNIPAIIVNEILKLQNEIILLFNQGILLLNQSLLMLNNSILLMIS